MSARESGRSEAAAGEAVAPPKTQRKRVNIEELGRQVRDQRIQPPSSVTLGSPPRTLGRVSHGANGACLSLEREREREMERGEAINYRKLIVSLQDVNNRSGFR